MKRHAFDAHLRKLDLTWPASCEQIRAAHHEQVLAWHPDRFTSAAQKATAEEKMKGINAAFDALTALAKAGMVLCGNCGELRAASGCVPCDARVESRSGHADAAEAKRRRVAEAEARVAAARERPQRSEVTRGHVDQAGKAGLPTVAYVIAFVLSGLLVRVLWMTSCSGYEPAPSVHEQPRYGTAAPVYGAAPPDTESIERRDTKAARSAKRGRPRSTNRQCPAGQSRRGNAANCTPDQTGPIEAPRALVSQPCDVGYRRRGDARNCTRDETLQLGSAPMREDQPDPSRAVAPEVDQRGVDEIGWLLIANRCRDAQEKFRELQLRGTEGNARTQFTSQWCPCPP